MIAPKKRIGQIVQAERLRDQVYDLLRQHLRSGAIEPGERLVEVTLAERLGVSRTPVREALFQLARDGLLVESERGYMLPEQTREAIRDRLEIRRLLDPVVASQACTEGTAKQKADLKRALEAEEKLVEVDDAFKYREANVNFRSIMLSMCRNVLLTKAAMLYDDLNQWYGIAGFRKIENRRKLTEFHRRIYQAIVDGKAEAAEKAMRDVLDLAITELPSLVPESGQEEGRRESA